MGSDESTGEDVGRGRDEDVELDVCCYKDGRNKECKNHTDRYNEWEKYTFLVRWYGQVVRREEEYVGKRVARMDVDGRRRGRICGEKSGEDGCGGEEKERKTEDEVDGTV